MKRKWKEKRVKTKRCPVFFVFSPSILILSKCATTWACIIWIMVNVEYGRCCEKNKVFTKTEIHLARNMRQFRKIAKPVALKPTQPRISLALNISASNARITFAFYILITKFHFHQFGWMLVLSALLYVFMWLFGYIFIFPFLFGALFFHI